MEVDACPNEKCKADFTGEPSPLVGIEITDVYDGILYWHCLACNHAWPRFARRERSHLYWSALREIAKRTDS